MAAATVPVRSGRCRSPWQHMQEHRCWRSVRVVCASTPSPPQPSSSGTTPWNFIFDLRERETEWLDGPKARLVTIVARDALGITQQELEDRMDVLLTLVPPLQDCIASLKPSLLASILRLPLDTVADVILTLKDLFPGADVGAMLSKQPALLLQSPAQLRRAAAQLRDLLQAQALDTLVAEQPLFLDIECVREVVKELELLMPRGVDVRALLRADPEWLLRAQRGQRWLGQNPDS